MLFSINYNLCKEFPAFTPYEIDDRSFHDVIKLYSEVRAMQINNNKRVEKVNNPIGSDNRGRIRVPAGDNWF